MHIANSCRTLKAKKNEDTDIVSKQQIKIDFIDLRDVNLSKDKLINKLS